MNASHTALSDLGPVALSHRDAVDEVRRRIGITHSYFDCWIYGFLENKKFDVDEAVAKLYRRFAFERDELAAHAVTEWMRENLRRGIVQDVGCDKQGRVVLYVTSSRDKPQASRRDESRRTFDMFVSYCTRLRRDSMRCQFVMLINQDKASMWGNLDMTFQADIALRVAKYYPGAIDKMYICNMGRTLSAFAKPIFSRLPSIVSDRIQIVTEADIKSGALLDLMDAAVLPVALGGRNACDDAAHWDGFAVRVERYFADMTWAIAERGKTVKEWELECLGIDPDDAHETTTTTTTPAAAAAAASSAAVTTASGAFVDTSSMSGPLAEHTLSRLASVVPSRRTSALRAAAAVGAGGATRPASLSMAAAAAGVGVSNASVAAWQAAAPTVAAAAATTTWPPLSSTSSLSSTRRQQQQAAAAAARLSHEPPASASRRLRQPPQQQPPSALSLPDSPDTMGPLQTCLSDDELAATAALPPPPLAVHDIAVTPTTYAKLPYAATTTATTSDATTTTTTTSDAAMTGVGVTTAATQGGEAAWSDVMSALPPAVALFFLEELLQWRLVVEEQESAARYALYDHSVADRARRSRNALKGLNVRDVRWYAMVPSPLRELYRLVLLGVTFVNVVYFAAALVFFAVFAADVVVTVFFGFHVKATHFFPLNCVLVNAMLQGVALCSRASDILVAVCRGRVVPMFERLGSYRGTMAEVVLFFGLVAVQFVVFCVYATSRGPLYGLQVAFATGWISAALLVAVSHVCFFTGVFVGRARDNRWATLPFFLALNVGGSSSSSSGGDAGLTRSSSVRRSVTYPLRLFRRRASQTSSQAQQQQQQQQTHHHHHHHHSGSSSRGSHTRWWWSSPHDATVRMSASLICGVPLTVSMLLGIGFLLSRDVALFACTLVASLLAAFCVSYYSDAVSNSLSGALMRTTLWMMTVVWLYITFTFGFRGYDAAWLTSVVVAGVLHGVFVLLSLCCVLQPHNSWLLRVSFLVVLLYLVACWVTLFPLLPYRLALLCLAFMLHNLLNVVLARRNLTSMTAVFLVSAAVLLLAMACVLLGWYGTVLQYITPHSLPPLLPSSPSSSSQQLLDMAYSAHAAPRSHPHNITTTTAAVAATVARSAAVAVATAAGVVSSPSSSSLAAYHHYPVCTLRLGADASYTIVDVALLTELVMAYTTAVREADWSRWFAGRELTYDGVAARFDSDDESWELHRFRGAAAANTTFFVLNNRYAKSSIVSIVGWIDAIALSPLSIFLPAEWAAQVVYVMSFMTRLIDYEWRSLVPSLAGYLAAQRRSLGTEVVLASFGVTGGVASAAAAQSQTQAIVFAAPGLLHVLRKFDVDADAYRRYVLAVGAAQGVLDLVGGHDATLKQRLRCNGGATHCLSQAFISAELLRECGDAHGRRHVPVD